jgi:hypothetical protein
MCCEGRFLGKVLFQDAFAMDFYYCCFDFLLVEKIFDNIDLKEDSIRFCGICDGGVQAELCVNLPSIHGDYVQLLSVFKHFCFGLC